MSSAADNLLESVVQITEQRDRDSLELSLVGTLQELIAARLIVFHHIREIHGQRRVVPSIRLEGDAEPVVTPEYEEARVSRPLEEAAEFAECLLAGEEQVQPCGETACYRYLYPARGSHGVVGFLEIVSARYSDADRRLVNGFLRIYRNYLAVLDESEHDTLTGLLNRKTFDRNITRILASRGEGEGERRHGGPGLDHWLAVLDIDHFKRVNDQYGHLYGDEVLLLLARLMKKTFRHGDRLFRFGGEEFVVVLEPATFEDARRVFERFRETVEGYDFPQVGRVTVSLGFVRIHSQDVPATVIGHADEALYYAKQHGRNRACSYEELVAAGELAGPTVTSEMELF